MLCKATLEFVKVRTAQVLLPALMVFSSSVSINHYSVTVSQHAQYQDPDTEAAKWK